ncbi:hypothetical protein CERSUDRAFT_116384 [Gelatoporia subvermispora B]|uniref:Uncharacterized protein n=1 Tax=Ceriporiopsis subvermispora (strain B) TaxID=914234 RepID=M2QU89_CERS8|nr:hypothetical protein CERSUDRAFT_116384 [Gelatoporia subvermispora B]
MSYNSYAPLPLPPSSMAPSYIPTPPPPSLPAKPLGRLSSQTNLQHAQMHTHSRKNAPLSARVAPPLPPPQVPLPLPPSRIDILPPQPTVSAPPAVAKIIGMPPVTDESAMFGRYPRAGELYPPIDPTRTLVMELIPKKFRNLEFVAAWANRFDRKKRIDVDPSFGKALIEFTRTDLAFQAYEGPRLTGGQGREHVRVYWFRHMPQTREMEEGEIEEGELLVPPPVPLPPKPAKKKQKKQKAGRNAQANAPALQDLLPLPPNPHLPRPPPYTSLSHLQTEYLQSNTTTWSGPPSAQEWNRASGSLMQSAIDFETMEEFTGPESMGTELASDDGYFDRAGVLDADEIRSYGGESIASSRQVSPKSQPDELPLDVNTWDDEAMTSELPLIIHEDEEIVTIGKHVLSSPATALRMQREEWQEQQPVPVPMEAPQPPAALAHVPSPLLESSDSWIPPLPPAPRIPTPPAPAPDDVKRALLARQRDLEERIARTKEEMTRKSGSPAAGTPPVQTKPGSPAVTAMPALSTADRAAAPVSLPVFPSSAPQAIAAPAPVNAGTRQLDALSAESELRRLVVKSRRAVGAVPTSVPSTPNLDVPTARRTVQASTLSVAQTSSPGNFDELAVSFIVETIQTVKTPPLKTVQAVEKDDLAAKQKRLEQQIAESKLLMAKLSTAKTKEEKENILSILKERRRLMEDDMKAGSPNTNSSRASPVPVAQSWQRQRARWPEPPPTPTVFVISDDEDDDA